MGQSSWIIRVYMQSQASLEERARGRFDYSGGERQYDYGSRDWNDVASSQGTWEEDSSLENLDRTGFVQTLTLTRWNWFQPSDLGNCKTISLCVLSHQVCGNLLKHIWETSIESS